MTPVPRWLLRMTKAEIAHLAIESEREWRALKRSNRELRKDAQEAKGLIRTNQRLLQRMHDMQSVINAHGLGGELPPRKGEL